MYRQRRPDEEQVRADAALSNALMILLYNCAY